MNTTHKKVDVPVCKTYGTVKLQDGRWHITAEPHVMIALKRVLPRIDKGEYNTVTISHTPENSRDIEWFCQRYPLTVEQPKVLLKSAEEHREHLLTLDQILGPKYKPKKLKLALEPRDYQSVAAEVLLRQGYLLLGDDVGLGKTCSAIIPMLDARTLPAVVVCYPHLQQQWRAEIYKFIPRLKTHIIDKSQPYALPHGFMAPDVIIITYSKLSGWAEVLAHWARYLVLDEIQELRRDESNKHGAAVCLARACQFVVGLSATPIFNYGGEIYNVLNVLKEDCLGTEEEFRREWCVPAGSNHYAFKDPRAFGSWIRDSKLMLRRTRKDVGRELPDVMRIPYTVQSDVAALEAIEDSARELAKIILARNERYRGEKMTAAGDFDVLMRQATGIAKAPYVADFADMVLATGEKLLLAGWHRNVYSIWEAKLQQKGWRIGWYTGSESPAHKHQVKTDFIRGDLDVIFISLRSGAGLDGLQEICKTVIVGELDYSPAVHNQLIGRLCRDGQGENVMAYFLIAETGSDPLMAEILGLKTVQAAGVENPNMSIVEVKTTGREDYVRRLAERYLHGIQQEAG